MFKKKWRARLLSTMPRAMIISFFYAAFFVGLFESLNTTTALNTSTIFTLVPLLTAFLAIILLNDKMSGRQLFVYVLGAIGTIWVIFNGDMNQLLSLTFNKGDLIFLLATLFMCCYSISMKLLYRNDEMIVLVFCTLLGGAFWMGLALLFTGQPLQWNLIQGQYALNMAYLVVGATLATVYLYQKTTVVLGPSRVNAYIYLNPMLVAILLLAIERETIVLAIVPGILLSTAATFVLQRNNKP